MSTKSFLFISSWMQPLKNLPLQERWNVIEAIVEYSTSGTISKSLGVMENIAFGFIRNEIDRMKRHRSEVCERKRAAANTRWGKNNKASKDMDATAVFNQHTDANACKCMHSDTPYDIESVSESNSESESKPESEKKSSTTSGVCAGGNAGKETSCDNSQLIPQFPATSNQAKIESIALRHHIPIEIDTLTSPDISPPGIINSRAKSVSSYGTTVCPCTDAER